jgi:hypothetical protein
MMGIRHGIAGLVLLGLAISPKLAHAAPVQAEQAALRTAYLALISGDHDYKGHRLKALKQVEAAGKLVGLNVSSDGKAKQPQASSDADLRGAQNALQGVHDAAVANGQGELQKHVDAAIKEITTALSIK